MPVARQVEHSRPAHLIGRLREEGEPHVALARRDLAVQLEGERAAGRRLVGLKAGNLPSEIQQTLDMGDVGFVADQDRDRTGWAALGAPGNLWPSCRVVTTWLSRFEPC